MVVLQRSVLQKMVVLRVWRPLNELNLDNSMGGLNTGTRRVLYQGNARAVLWNVKLWLPEASTPSKVSLRWSFGQRDIGRYNTGNAQAAA